MSDERRKTPDRRKGDRRLDERRKGGIGEVQPDRRKGPRREEERGGRPDPQPRREQTRD